MSTLLQIGETRRLNWQGPRPPIDSYFALFQEFITEVWVPLPKPIGASVDSFNFLYFLLHQIYLFPTTSEIFVDVGESIHLIGKIHGDNCTIRVQYGQDLAATEMKKPELLWLLCSLVAQLSRSMSQAGVDIDRYVREFPPFLAVWGPLSGSSSSALRGGAVYTDEMSRDELLARLRGQGLIGDHEQ